MSTSNPYEAPSTETKTVLEVEEVVAPVVEQPEEQPEPAEEEEVPSGSIKEVLAWVGDDVDKAKKALEAEKAGAGRKTLVADLEGLIDG